MDPVIFSSLEEQQCFSNFTSSILFNSWMSSGIFFYKFAIFRKLDGKPELLDGWKERVQRFLGLVLRL